MCIYMVPPPKKTYLFTMFTCIYGVFLHILGGYVLRFLNKFGHSFEGEYHIYITVDVDKLVRHDGSGVKRS